MFLVGCSGIPRNLPEPVLIERKILVKIEDGHFKYGFITGTGTGFLIHRTIKSNYFLTAQHICNKPKTIPADKYEGAGNGELNVLNSALLIVNDNKKYATKIIYEDSTNDLCLISTPNSREINFYLFELSKKNVKIGETVRTIGAPDGYLNKNFIYNTTGNYLGKTLSENILKEGYSFYITYGASGSPILNENFKVIGMVSGFEKNFNNLTWGSNYDKLKELILWVKTFKN